MPRAARLYSQGILRLSSKIRLEISDILIQEHGGDVFLERQAIGGICFSGSQDAIVERDKEMMSATELLLSTLSTTSPKTWSGIFAASSNASKNRRFNSGPSASATR